MDKPMHTPGPWYARNGMIASESDPSGQTIAHVKNDADANRIKECVNACDGMVDPGAAIPELIAALESLVTHWEEALTVHIYDADNGEHPTAEDKAYVAGIRDVIARAKDGK